ncbi:MAG: NAD(P)/FAD-dependent oxidoreductase [Flavobacteriales bacterium]
MMENSIEQFDAIVIGAGPSGSVTSAYLNKHGLKVLVLERAVFPRFVIGESLLPLSMGHWEEAGLLPDLMKQNYAVKRGARFIRKGVVLDLAFAENFTEGWTWTWQVPRAHFDKVMADTASAAGVDIRYGHEVTKVDLDADDHAIVHAKCGDKTMTAQAPFIIDSSGYGGTLVSLFGLKDEPAGNDRMAMFTHVPETEEHRELYKDPMQISFEIVETDLWFWSIPFSNGTTSLGFVGHKRHFSSIEASASTSEAFKKMLKTQKGFGTRYDAPEFLFEPKVIRDYAHYNEKLHGKHYVLTGNCAGFLDPVFSSGVAFATNSGLLAAKLYLKQRAGEPVDWEMDYAKPVRDGATVFKTYVETWYNGDLHTIFFAPELTQSIKEQIVSVLAGYVWDKKNPFVAKHDRIVRTLAQVVRMEAHGKTSAEKLDAITASFTNGKSVEGSQQNGVSKDQLTGEKAS